MNDLFAQISISLDGFIKGAGGWLDWFAANEPAEVFATEALRTRGATEFGRTAHAVIAEYWKTSDTQLQTPERPEQARLTNSLPKYVLSHGNLDVE